MERKFILISLLLEALIVLVITIREESLTGGVILTAWGVVYVGFLITVYIVLKR